MAERKVSLTELLAGMEDFLRSNPWFCLAWFGTIAALDLAYWLLYDFASSTALPSHLNDDVSYVETLALLLQTFLYAVAGTMLVVFGLKLGRPGEKQEANWRNVPRSENIHAVFA